MPVPEISLRFVLYCILSWFEGLVVVVVCAYLLLSLVTANRREFTFRHWGGNEMIDSPYRSGGEMRLRIKAVERSLAMGDCHMSSVPVSSRRPRLFCGRMPR